VARVVEAQAAVLDQAVFRDTEGQADGPVLGQVAASHGAVTALMQAHPTEVGELHLAVLDDHALAAADGDQWPLSSGLAVVAHLKATNNHVVHVGRGERKAAHAHLHAVPSGLAADVDAEHLRRRVPVERLRDHVGRALPDRHHPLQRLVLVDGVLADHLQRMVVLPEDLRNPALCLVVVGAGEARV